MSDRINTSANLDLSQVGIFFTIRNKIKRKQSFCESKISLEKFFFPKQKRMSIVGGGRSELVTMGTRQRAIVALNSNREFKHLGVYFNFKDWNEIK